MLLAWFEFRRGKRKKPDAQEFEFNLEDNLFDLQEELKNKTYKHSSYSSFYVCDPKLRHIHKATVRDRVLHQAIFRRLYWIFDRGFIFDSYSCRFGKGTHKAVARLEVFARKLSKNSRKTIFVLHCDIKKFFESVNHAILPDLIKREIQDSEAIWIIEQVIQSFEKERNKGLPLGNVTSQLFANIYLNELDRYVKRALKIKYYLRYCDDFIILGESREYLMGLVTTIGNFLKQKLSLNLRKEKIIVRKYSQGFDFLGYIALPYYKVLRTKTKRRMFRKIVNNKLRLRQGLMSEESFKRSLQSYLGILKHCKGFRLKKIIKHEVRRRKENRRKNFGALGEREDF